MSNLYSNLRRIDVEEMQTCLLTHKLRRKTASIHDTLCMKYHVPTDTMNVSWKLEISRFTAT